MEPPILELLPPLLWCEARMETQVAETAIIAVGLILAVPRLTAVLYRFFRTRPWFDRHREREKDHYKCVLGVEVPDAFAQKMISLYVISAFQHVLGSMLCAPAVFGLGLSTPAAAAMVRHGALVELSWEILDTVDRLWERFKDPNGAKLQPWAVLRFFFIHHLMQWSLIIPMNLHYSHLSEYHELVFMLKCAAGISILGDFNVKCCDALKRHELRQMVVWSALVLVVNVYTRALRYCWTVFKILRLFYVSEAYIELAVGFLVGVLAMPYIASRFIPQMWLRLLRLVKKYLQGGSPIVDQKEAEEKPLADGHGNEHQP